MLSHRQQVARMRRLAVRALGAYPLADPELRFIAHGENTTFRVDATASGGRERFLLRVHRPARHGRHVDPVAASDHRTRYQVAVSCDGPPLPQRNPARQAGAGSIARISSAPLTHLEAFPVRSTTGVVNPWHVQPPTLTGPPPPLPGAWPARIAPA